MHLPRGWALFAPQLSLPVHSHTLERETMKKMPRMFDWMLVTLLLIALIAALAPQQLPVSLYKLSLITMAAVVGYWIDRSLFPYARPDNQSIQPYDMIVAAAMLRRAIIVGCAMLAVSLGV
jgi:hypothetical protein